MRIKHGLYGVLVIADTKNRKCQEILKSKMWRWKDRHQIFNKCF